MKGRNDAAVENEKQKECQVDGVKPTELSQAAETKSMDEKLMKVEAVWYGSSCIRPAVCRRHQRSSLVDNEDGM